MVISDKLPTGQIRFGPSPLWNPEQQSGGVHEQQPPAGKQKLVVSIKFLIEMLFLELSRDD